MSDDTKLLEKRKIPQQKRSKERVARILKAAHELLLEEGYNKVTTDGIAQRAQVPVGTLYQFFPNKLSIFADLSREAMIRIDEMTGAELKKNAEAMDWRELVDWFLGATYEAYKTYPGYLQLMRVINSTPEFFQLQRVETNPIASVLAERLLAKNPDMQEYEIIEIARVIIQAGNSVQDLILATDEPEVAARMLDYWRIMTKGYLSHFLD